MTTDQLILEIKNLFKAENTNKWINYSNCINGIHIDFRVYSTKEESFLDYIMINEKEYPIELHYLSRGKTSQNIINTLLAVLS